MQTLKLSFSLPDATHPQMELRVSSSNSDCGVLIELSARGPSMACGKSELNTLASTEDEYVLGGYAGI